MRSVYLLKDIARISGQSVHTVKYYLKLDLIREVGRSPGTNFRFFDDSTVAHLNKIRQLRLKNISLKEIRHIMTWEEGA